MRCIYESVTRILSLRVQVFGRRASSFGVLRRSSSRPNAVLAPIRFDAGNLCEGLLAECPHDVVTVGMGCLGRISLQTIKCPILRPNPEIGKFTF